MKRWTEEQKAIFLQHAGKLPDEEVARLLNRSLQDVKSRRGWLKITIERPHKFPKAWKEFVRSNFRTMTNKAMGERLRQQFPAIEITPNSIKSFMKNQNLKRTPEDFDYIRNTLVEAGAFKKDDSRKRQPGTVRYMLYHKRRRLCIKLENGKFKPYEIWLWEQSYGKPPRDMRVVIIDPFKPTVIENLELVTYSVHTKKVGEVTMHITSGATKREFVKVAPRKFQRLESYLWRQVHGPIPKGKYVRKINPDLPTTIDNLHLQDKPYFTGEGSKNLHDWFVVATFSRGQYKDFGAMLKSGILEPEAVELVIDTLREQIRHNRALKNLKNAGNSPGSSLDDQVEGLST